jgi:hypothetical protein
VVHEAGQGAQGGDLLGEGRFIERPALAAASRARRPRTMSWQEKALVEATPISGPRGWEARSDSRAMELSATLTTDDAVGLVPAVAERREGVGVSPDWLTKRAVVRGGMGGSR